MIRCRYDIFVAGMLLATAGWLEAGYTVGLDLTDAPAVFAPTSVSPETPSIYPYPATAADSFDGVLAGLTSNELSLRLAIAVQEVFRDAQIEQPGYMLRVRINPTPVSSQMGTNVVLGSAGINPVPSVYGLAEVNSANTRPDRDPDLAPYYPNNRFAAVYLDAIGEIGVSFHTQDEAINAIAGTVAHEIAHTLGVGTHDPATPINGRYSVLASGAEGLPPGERLKARTFLPITPVGGGGMAISTLQANAGLTRVTDFNFDGVTNVIDRTIYQSNAGRGGISVAQGDASNDGIVNVIDRALYQRAIAMADDARPTEVNAEAFFDSSTGLLTLHVLTGSINSLYIPGTGAAFASPAVLRGQDGGVWNTYTDPSGWNIESLRFTSEGNLPAGVWTLLSIEGVPPDHLVAIAADGKYVSISVQAVPEPAVLLLPVFLQFCLRRERRSAC